MIKLKIATSEDFSLIRQLATKIWQEHYTPIIRQEQIDYMLPLFYSEEAFLKQKNDGQIFYLIENDEAPVGFLGITPKSETEIFINKFYIDQRGKGLGKIVFEKILTQYKATKTIRLNVNKNNYKSINFYYKLGFSIENTAVFDIGNGFVMDDFMMIREL